MLARPPLWAAPRTAAAAPAAASVPLRRHGALESSAAGGGAEAALARRHMEPPEDSPMAEMFTLFPHESAVVMQRGIELGIVCSCALVIHCMALVLQFWPSARYPDFLLRGFCVARIVCAVPRPYFWFRTRRLFVQARYQPTPQLVTQRLLDIYAHPFGVERGLLLFYYGWLACITVVVCVVRLEAEQTSFTQQLWRHCLLNFVSIVLHRILCVLLFYFLMTSDFKRGITPDVLEKYTKRLAFIRSTSKTREQLGGGDMECSICFGPYSEGEDIRKLTCGHHFHQRCVDVWLLGHQNRCPLCLLVVGPQN
uniref:RING-type E3 ubiquitin transferase n=1 Tax=Pyrodinium bahamense TaxID=73915 RepID=A0A7S0F8V0_9DINO|mmetsp:Transcript_13179/g.36388  ORF Transcript_13179/g.36388 Transcript_13179/m.36388 type:complete len:310 (+) Transcript_13179:101-1030(+)